MVAIDLKSLVGRLSAIGRRQLEAAAGLTLSRSHYNVEIEHLLLKLVETQGTDINVLLRKQGVDSGRVVAELTGRSTSCAPAMPGRPRSRRTSSPGCGRPGCWPRSRPGPGASARGTCWRRCSPTRRCSAR
jgi:hypothetical protein